MSSIDIQPCHQVSKEGYILVMSMLVLALFSFLIGTLISITTPEVVSADYHQQERVAFYMADAGIRYVVSSLSQDIQDGITDFTSMVEMVNYAAPDGFEFSTIHVIKKVPDSEYSIFSVTGYYSKAEVSLEATITRPQLMQNAGIFGNEQLKVQPSGSLYSYDSREVVYPVPGDSTGQANIGSNEDIQIPNDIVLDGQLFIGSDESGTTATAPVGYDSKETGWVNPDPFGMNDGWLAEAFLFYSMAGNNDNIQVPEIKNGALKTKPGDDITFSGGNYYLDSLYIAAGSTLTIDTSAENPVTIYLNGKMTAQPNSLINVTNGLPSDFYIFSNSTDPISIQPNSDFGAFVYAPNADVNVQPNGDLHGVFWGNEVALQPGNDIYIDISLLDKFRSTQIQLVQWKQVYRKQEEL